MKIRKRKHDQGHYFKNLHCLSGCKRNDVLFVLKELFVRQAIFGEHLKRSTEDGKATVIVGRVKFVRRDFNKRHK